VTHANDGHRENLVAYHVKDPENAHSDSVAILDAPQFGTPGWAGILLQAVDLRADSPPGSYR
jgi:hypothetical protein